MARRWQGAALALVLGLIAQAAAQQYLPQLYQLAMKTEGGDYCDVLTMNAPLTANVGGWAIKCESKTKPPVAGFNVLLDPTQPGFMDPIKTVTSPFALGIRPGSGAPASVFQDGLVMSFIGAPSTPGLEPFVDGVFAFQTAPSVAGLNVTFGDNGSQLLFLTLLPTMPGAPTKYCRVGPYYAQAANSTAVPVSAMENMVVCDQTSWKAATRFTIEPVGWNWNYKRIQLTSVRSGKICGNREFTQNDTYVTCNNGEQAGVQDWSADFYDWVLRKPELPLRTGAEFTVQAWIEYALATSIWSTDKSGYIHSNLFPMVGEKVLQPAGNKPYYSMIKDEPGSSNTTITPGTKVLLRASENGRYCWVHGTAPFRIQCTATAKELADTSDRSKFQFTYGEFIPSNN